MIKLVKGDLLKADVEALVNTVNTVGVMGKGIALQFKKAFPENFKAYKKACDAKLVKLGKMFLFERRGLFNPKYIFNFPTKRHWKDSAKIEDIESGLKDLVGQIERLKIQSIVVPPLGCGQGGLNWAEVYPLIEKAFENLDVNICIYPPLGSPKPDTMVDRTSRPKMTAGRAAVIGLMGRYRVLGYPMSLLEIHKLAYFLQESGQPLKLHFKKHLYGPYADELRHVLNRLEGHFTQGFGDGKNKPDTPIELLPNAIKEAEKFLEKHPATQKRLKRVTDLIEGFETPYGMELLSTVHWVVKKSSKNLKKGIESVIANVYQWNERKRQIIKNDHIEIAWNQLEQQKWI